MSLRPLRRLVTEWQPQLGDRSDPLTALAAGWSAVVGERVAQHTQPLELKDGVLLIATRSSAWSQELQFFEPRIVESLTRAGGPAVTRLRFRSGGLRKPKGPSGPGARPARPRRSPVREPEAEPAPDVPAALERVRRRIAEAAGSAPRRCTDCGAPSEGVRCAPCLGARRQTRRLELERLLFSAPWIDAAGVHALLPGLEAGELEEVRRGLLQRWWLALERVRRTTRPPSERERQIASSYVLLQSGLAPEAIGAAVVRNVLGADLEARLFGSPGPAEGAAKGEDR